MKKLKPLMFILGFFLVIVGTMMVYKGMMESRSGQFEAVKDLYPQPAPPPVSR